MFGGPGKPETALRGEHPAAQRDRFAHRRQQLGEEAVPDEELQQQRHVAHHLDIARGELGEQPVARQACNADQRAQQCGKDDAQGRHLEGVEQAHAEGTRIALRGVVGDQGFGDLEAGFTAEEAEAHLDLARGEVVQGVGHQVPAHADHGEQQQDLVGDAADTFVAEHRCFDLEEERGGGCKAARLRGPPASEDEQGPDQRSGGAYIRPPSFHSAFWPRSRPSGPMLRW
jgi:hypothetical protein